MFIHVYWRDTDRRDKCSVLEFGHVRSTDLGQDPSQSCSSLLLIYLFYSMARCHRKRTSIMAMRKIPGNAWSNDYPRHFRSSLSRLCPPPGRAALSYLLCLSSRLADAFPRESRSSSSAETKFATNRARSVISSLILFQRLPTMASPCYLMIRLRPDPQCLRHLDSKTIEHSCHRQRNADRL